MTGFFITFEGGEGAGKSTQSRLLRDRFLALGRDVILTREPGGSPGAEALRELLLFGEASLSARAQVLAHMAARADHLDEVILPALARGAIVLCDRFHDSTLVYQGYGLAQGDTESLAFITALRRLLGRDPDLTLFLDVPPELGEARVASRGGRSDRYEKEARAFHERVSVGFQCIAKQEPWRITRIDASRPENEVAENIFITVSDRLSE